MTAVLESDWTYNTDLADTITISVPAGVSDGELLIMVAGNDSVSSLGMNNVTGWTREVNLGGDPDPDCCLAVYSRVASSEPPSYDVVSTTSGGDLVGYMFRFTSAADDWTDGVFGAGGTQDSNSTTFASPAITTAVDDSLAISFVYFDGQDGDPFTTSGTGWGTTPDDDSNDGAGLSTGFISKVIPSTGTTQAVTWTAQVADTWCSVQIAVPPGGILPQVQHMRRLMEIS